VTVLKYERDNSPEKLNPMLTNKHSFQLEEFKYSFYALFGLPMT